MTIINTLEEWHKNAVLISSPLLIKPVIARSKIDFIYRTMKNCFGDKFFNLKVGIDIPLDKSLWINQLLANKNHIGSVGALYQVSQLIEYAGKLDDSISQDIKRLSKSSRNLRSFFYELFIFNFLDKNKIVNQKKVVIANQELEGTCVIEELEFLFECRKVFLPKINELDILKRLMDVFVLNGKNINKSLGMICGVKLNRPIECIYRSVFEEKINKFFRKLNSSLGFATIDYLDEDETGLFKATDYSKASLLEAKELSKYDIVFSVIPNGIKDGMIHLRVGIQCFFNVAHSAIYKKFESALKEKRNQHKNSTYKNQIIFIDTEIFPGLDMDLFHTQSSFDLDIIKKVHQKVNKKSILCITRRIYSVEQPTVFTDIICPSHLEKAGRFLNRSLNNSFITGQHSITIQ